MKYKHIQHIFFDLDHTLWDFEASSMHTLKKMFDFFQLKTIGVPDFLHFDKAYHAHNTRLWEQYRNGSMAKEVLRSKRFLETLNDFGAADALLAEKMSAYYLYHAPRTVFLFPNTMKVLAYLQKKYPLYIITNGFEEVQHIKMKTSGMDKYFSHIITSEAAGVKKPAAEIFQYAMKQSNAKPSFSLMIGDDPEVDVQGARNTGMEAILFDPQHIHQNTNGIPSIQNLEMLMNLL